MLFPLNHELENVENIWLMQLLYDTILDGDIIVDQRWAVHYWNVQDVTNQNNDPLKE